MTHARSAFYPFLSLSQPFPSTPHHSPYSQISSQSPLCKYKHVLTRVQFLRPQVAILCPALEHSSWNPVEMLHSCPSSVHLQNHTKQGQALPLWNISKYGNWRLVPPHPTLSGLNFFDLDYFFSHFSQVMVSGWCLLPIISYMYRTHNQPKDVPKVEKKIDPFSPFHPSISNNNRSRWY